MDATDVDYPHPLTHKPLQQRHLSPFPAFVTTAKKTSHATTTSRPQRLSVSSPMLHRFQANATPFLHQRLSILQNRLPCQLPPKYRKKSHRLALLFIPLSTILRKNSTLKALKYLTISTIYWIISI